jgi:hypothetical protein
VPKELLKCTCTALQFLAIGTDTFILVCLELEYHFSIMGIAISAECDFKFNLLLVCPESNCPKNSHKHFNMKYFFIVVSSSVCPLLACSHDLQTLIGVSTGLFTITHWLTPAQAQIATVRLWWLLAVAMLSNISNKA